MKSLHSLLLIGCDIQIWQFKLLVMGSVGILTLVALRFGHCLPLSPSAPAADLQASGQYVRKVIHDIA